MGVVFIHINFPGIIGQIIKDVASYAVPVFFMIAGYYAYKKDQSTIKRRLLKITKIFLYAYILFFVFSAAFAVYNYQIGDWISKQFNWKTPIMYICFCTIDFAIPLWYLIAMIEVYVVWLLVVKNNKEHVFLKLLPFLFVLQIILTMYCETKETEWFWKTNFITRAMPWFLLGYFFHTEKAEFIRDLNVWAFIVLTLIGSLISIVPTAFDFGLKFNVIGYIPFAIGLFCIAVKYGGGYWFIQADRVYRSEFIFKYLYISCYYRQSPGVHLFRFS